MHQHLRHTRAPIPSLPGILAWLFLSRHMRRVTRIYKAVIRQIVVLEEGKKEKCRDCPTRRRSLETWDGVAQR